VTILSVAILLSIFAGPGFAQTDPRDIVRKSVQTDDRNAKLTSEYTYVVHNTMRQLDGGGKVKSTETDTHEILFIGGKRYSRLTEKDGKPLPPKEEAKQQQHIDHAIAEAKKLSPEERERRLAERERKRAKDREGIRNIPDAFDFVLFREEDVGGRPAFVIGVTPKAGYRGPNHDFLSKMQGTLWIHKADYHWVKAEAETLDTISWGFFVARLSKGSRLSFEQTRVNDEIWLPRRAAVKASARLGLVKKFNIEQDTTFSNYRKFSTDSKIISATEVQ
jgi:hypothetical protein